MTDTNPEVPVSKSEPKNIEVALSRKSRGHQIGDTIKVGKSEADRLEVEHLAKRTAGSKTD